MQEGCVQVIAYQEDERCEPRSIWLLGGYSFCTYIFPSKLIACFLFCVCTGFQHRHKTIVVE